MIVFPPDTLDVPRLVLNGLSKDFTATRAGTIHAVRELTLEVADHELLAIVGPSASGKTTLLRLIAGLEMADQGRITFGERDFTHAPARERDIAMVFQTLALFPHLTVAANVGLGLKLRRVARGQIAERVQDIAARLEISNCLDRHPAELSGGQRQRVALARALIRRPALLLLDEPFSNLDRHLRRQLCRVLRSLHSDFKLTTLLVTHDLAEAEALGNRLAIMNAGQLAQVGTAESLRAAPTSPFVAEFLGQDEL